MLAMNTFSNLLAEKSLNRLPCLSISTVEEPHARSQQGGSVRFTQSVIEYNYRRIQRWSTRGCHFLQLLGSWTVVHLVLAQSSATYDVILLYICIRLYVADLAFDKLLIQASILGGPCVCGIPIRPWSPRVALKSLRKRCTARRVPTTYPRIPPSWTSAPAPLNNDFPYIWPSLLQCGYHQTNQWFYSN